MCRSKQIKTLKRILYIDLKFPLLTGTFVYREIEILRNAGYEIIIASMAKPIKNHISDEALYFLNETIYLDQVSFLKKIYAQLRLCYKEFPTWIKLLSIAFREKEIRNFKDRLRIIYHFVQSGYLYIIVKDKQINHIHSPFLTGSATVTFFLSQYLKIPFTFTMHASNIYIDPIMLATKLRFCNKAVTISEYNKNFLISKYGKHLDKKINIIHCGIDVNKFNPSQRKKYDKPVILSVGQLTKRKGFLYLLQALHILKSRRIKFTCYIIGDGEEKEYLLKQQNLLGLNEMVTFLGRQPQEKVKKFLSHTMVFTLSSIITKNGEREGIPVALMEAMAMEIAVVSTTTVGIPELIKHNEEGLLVKPKDPIHLAKAIEILLCNKTLRNNLGEAARKKIINEFNIDHTPILFEKLLY